MIRIPEGKINPIKFKELVGKIAITIWKESLHLNNMDNRIILSLFIIPSPQNNGIIHLLTDLISQELDDLYSNEKYYFGLYYETLLFRTSDKYEERFFDNDASFELNKQSYLEAYEEFLTINPRYGKLFFLDNQYLINNLRYCETKECFKAKLEFLFEKFDEINNQLGKILDYNYFKKVVVINSQKRKIRLHFLEEMGITSCPYCDITPITISDTKSEIDIDHILPKHCYKLFSCSLGNMVTSCKACNSTYKATSQKTIANPRSEGFEKDARFNAALKSGYIFDHLEGKLQSPTIGDIFNLEIIQSTDVDPEKKIRIDNSLEIFELCRRYNSCGPLQYAARNILNIRKYFSTFNTETLQYASRQKEEIVLKQSKKEIIKKIYKHLDGNYDELSFTNFPYSKMTNDLIKGYENVVNKSDAANFN